MKCYRLMFAALLTLPPSAYAQQPPSDDVLSGYLRRSYAAVSKDLLAAVEMLPEQDLGFRPAGAVEKVRTFGEIAAHVVVVNSWVCSTGDGKPPSTTKFDPALAKEKARLIAFINETDARCTTYLASVNDAALTQVVTSGPTDKQLQAVRGHAIVFAIAHANEHYGNLVTYLRAKGLVPPATPSQALFFSTGRTP